MKGFDDPVTIADIKAQTLIIRGIRRFWPDLRIVSEETKEFNGDLGFNIQDLNPNLFDEDSLAGGVPATEQ